MYLCVFYPTYGVHIESHLRVVHIIFWLFLITTVEPYRFILMHDKGETSKLVQNFVNFLNNQFSKHANVIHSDNRIVFTSNPMKQFYAKKRIIHQASCVNCN